MNLFFLDSGWEEVNLSIDNDISYIFGHDHKKYQILSDSSGRKYWSILGQKINIRENDPKVLSYSQQDNWVVEIFHLADGLCVTKYYEGYCPIIITPAFQSLYSSETITSRLSSYKKKFGSALEPTPYRDYIYNKSIKQYEEFSDQTDCYFRDVMPNNILSNEDFSDFKIIDVCSIEQGHVLSKWKDPFPDLNKPWPVSQRRIIGF